MMAAVDGGAVIRNGQGLCAPQSPSERSASFNQAVTSGATTGVGGSAWHVGLHQPGLDWPDGDRRNSMQKGAWLQYAMRN